MFMLLLHNDNDNDDVDVDYDDFMADSCEHNCIIEFNRLRESETGFGRCSTNTTPTLFHNKNMLIMPEVVCL